MDLTRSGELCAILISLSIIYRAYERYKVLLPLHNINHCFINLAGLWTFTRSGDLSAIFTSLLNIYRAYVPYNVLQPLHNIKHHFHKFTELMYFYKVR
jgi:hypothetical protein